MARSVTAVQRVGGAVMRSISRSLFLSLALFAVSGVAVEAASAKTAGDAAAQARTGHFVRSYKIAYEPRMFVEGINNQGWIVGHWTDTAGKTHWFVMNPFLPMFSDVANHGVRHFTGLSTNKTGGL